MKVNFLSHNVPESPVLHCPPLDRPLILFFWGGGIGGETKELVYRLVGTTGLEAGDPGQSRCVWKLQAQGSVQADGLLPQGTSVSFF